MTDVFISYSSRNVQYVRDLAEYLRSRGLDVWFDDHIETGSSWSDTIFEAINQCAAFIVVMSPPALDSNWVEKECLYAEKRRKPRFPLLLEGEEFPFLIDVQYTDVRDGQMPPDSYLELVLEAVTAAQAAKPATTSTQPPSRRPSIRGLAAALALIAILVGAVALLNASATPSAPGATSIPATHLTTPAETFQPEPITAGTSVFGTIDDASPERWYQFTANQGAHGGNGRGSRPVSRVGWAGRYLPGL